MSGSRKKSRRRRQKVARWLSRERRQPIRPAPPVPATLDLKLFYPCGHPRTPENTLAARKRGQKWCRICKLARSRSWAAKRRADPEAREAINADYRERYAANSEFRVRKVAASARLRALKAAEKRVAARTELRKVEERSAALMARRLRAYRDDRCDCAICRYAAVHEQLWYSGFTSRRANPGLGGKWCAVTYTAEGGIAGMERYPTRAAAHAAVPQGVPCAVVDMSVVNTQRMTLGQFLLDTGRPMIEKPYARGNGRGGAQSPSTI